MTDYVRALAGGGRPPDALFLAAIAAVAEIVRARLGRGYWHLPPRYFGYPDARPTWDAEFPVGTAPDVAVDGFLDAFAGHNRDYLLDRVRLGFEVDALVAGCYVPRFLLARQRTHDPHGYAVYANVRGAVDPLVADGRLCPDPPTAGGYTGDHVLRFPNRTGAVADRAAIDRTVRSDAAWNTVFPHVGRVGTRAQEGLRDRIAAFPDHGVAAFTTHVVTAVVRDRARPAVHAWQVPTTEVDDGDGVTRLFRTVAAGWAPDAPADYHGLLLRRLSGLLRASGAADPDERAVLEALVGALETGDRVPSAAELGRRVGIADRREASAIMNRIIRRAGLLSEDE